MNFLPNGTLLDLGLLAELAKLVMFSIFIERALSIVFEWKPWAERLSEWNLKAPIAVAFSASLCVLLPFDVLRHFSATSPAPQASMLGGIVTGFIVAGGSVGSIKLFQDVLGFSKQARDASIDSKARVAQAQQLGANVALLNAQVLQQNAFEAASEKGITTAQLLAPTVKPSSGAAQVQSKTDAPKFGTAQR